MKNILSTILFVIIASVFHSSNAQQASKSETISERKFRKLMKKDNVAIIDVRTEKEYSEGHIPDAQNIDVQKEDFAAQVQSLDKSKTYLLYCRSGKRSAKALNILKETGFQKVYHLKEGFIEWDGAKE
jgi:rhodanese-related sulfurtransferase